MHNRKSVNVFQVFQVAWLNQECEMSSTGPRWIGCTRGCGLWLDISITHGLIRRRSTGDQLLITVAPETRHLKKMAERLQSVLACLRSLLQVLESRDLWWVYMYTTHVCVCVCF
jgi:hypothetical protein